MHRPNFFTTMLVGFVLTVFAFVPQIDAAPSPATAPAAPVAAPVA